MKVGDRVRRAGGNDIHGVVERIGDSGGIVVRWRSNIIQGTFVASDLELVDAPAPPLHRFTVGERVREFRPYGVDKVPGTAVGKVECVSSDGEAVAVRWEGDFSGNMHTPGDLEPYPAPPPQMPGAPLPMILHCPSCGLRHIDKPDPAAGWTNPPHRSHLCSRCGTVWRPCDIATVGVELIATIGKNDELRAPPMVEAYGHRGGARVKTLEERIAAARAALEGI